MSVKRGQILSVDFLTATVLIIMALALVAHALEFSARASFDQKSAPVIAPLLISAPSSCVRFSNSTAADYCASTGWSCDGSVRVYRRIIACGDGTNCLKEVRICG